MKKIKVEIYEDGRAFFESKGGITTFAAITGLDFVREALRKNLVGRETQTGPKLEKRIKEHKLKGRFELQAANIPDPDEVDSDTVNNALFPEQLSDAKEDSPESGATDGHDVRDESRNDHNPEGFGNHPDENGHEPGSDPGAPGQSHGDADPDAGRDDRQGGV